MCHLPLGILHENWPTITTYCNSLLYGCVWLLPKIALPKVLLAKIWVKVLLIHELADIGGKSEAEFACKKVGNSPNKGQIFGHSQNVSKVKFGYTI